MKRFLLFSLICIVFNSSAADQTPLTAAIGRGDLSSATMHRSLYDDERELMEAIYAGLEKAIKSGKCDHLKDLETALNVTIDFSDKSCEGLIRSVMRDTNRKGFEFLLEHKVNQKLVKKLLKSGKFAEKNVFGAVQIMEGKKPTEGDWKKEVKNIQQPTALHNTPPPAYTPERRPFVLGGCCPQIYAGVVKILGS